MTWPCFQLKVLEKILITDFIFLFIYFFATAVTATTLCILLSRRQQTQKKDKYILVLLSLKKCRFLPLFKIRNTRLQHVIFCSQSKFSFPLFKNRQKHFKKGLKNKRLPPVPSLHLRSPNPASVRFKFSKPQLIPVRSPSYY